MQMRVLRSLLSLAAACALFAPGHCAAQVVYQGFSEAKASSNTTSLTIATPAGTAAGELLIAAVATDQNTSGSLSPPAGQGWALIDLGNETGTLTFGVWWKVASAVEPAGYTFTWNSSQEAYGWVMRFSGQAAAPLDAVATTSGRSFSPTSPSVGSSVANALILRLGGFDDDDVTIDDPGLPGHAAITMDESGGGSGTVSGGAGYIVQPSAGPSGTSNFSLNGSEQYRTVTIAIAPGRHFAIDHDGSASTCQLEPVTISAHDGLHGVDSGYLGTIALSTSTGNGDWSLVSGTGTLSNLSGGNASYSFSAADAGSVVLGLSDTFDETVDVDVSEGAMSESISEDPALTFSSLTASDTVRDEFNAVVYSGNDGSQSWSGSWIERDDDGSASSGNVQVTGGEVSLEDYPNTDGDPGLERQADLTGISSAVFSFDFRTTAGVDVDDSVFVEASADGGGSWTVLEDITGINGATSGSRSYDITGFASSNTRVRFRVNGLNGTGGTACCYGANGEQFLVDNVQISLTTPQACGVDHFTLGHDGSGINCLSEPITVTARDALGAVLTGYDQQIMLDTQSGTGSWSLVSGAGSLSDPVPGDGLASYLFDSADGGVAVFGLSYPSGTAALDVDVYQSSGPSVRDDDTEGILVFGPSGFTVTASALPNPPPDPINDPIAPQVAGAAFALHLTAYGQTPTDPICGVIEAYSGTRSLRFWFGYADPGTGTRQVTIDGSAIALAEAAATAQAVTFSAGQASVLAKYKDAGQIAIALKDESPAEPAAGIRGATGPFVVQPADLVITRIARTDGSPNPGATSPAGAVFVAAGAPFAVDVEARDAEGDLTPNYGNEISPEGILLSASTLVAPGGGRNGSADDGSIQNGSAFGAIAPAGSFTGDAFAWDEVGAIRLRASIGDADYLGSGDVTGTESGVVGRFTPWDFAVALNAPSFETGCTAGSFGYLGAPFGYTVGGEPTIGITARSAAGTTTRNYGGSWWRLTNTSLANRSYAALSGTLDTAGLPAIAGDPAIVENGDGTGTLTFSSGAGLRFARTALVAPFQGEISLSIDVLDLDGVSYPGNPARFGQVLPAGGIAFSSGKEQRFGRVVVGNAHGSELLPLDVPLLAQHYDGVGFVTNSGDSCTSIATSDLALIKNPPILPTFSTIANDPLLAGDAGHSLSAPGQGNGGSVDVEADLGVAAAPWLRYDWPHDGNTDGVFDDDPIGHATFGIFTGDAPLIYLREIY